MDAIASGPADALGLGPEFRAHWALGSVVQVLGRFPGHGWRLIAVALRSPVVNNRNAALNALDTWDRAYWPGEVSATLRAVAHEEPDARLHDRIDKLLRGKRAPEPQIRVPEQG